MRGTRRRSICLTTISSSLCPWSTQMAWLGATTSLMRSAKTLVAALAPAQIPSSSPKYTESSKYLRS